VTIGDTLISSVKMLATLACAEVNRLSWLVQYTVPVRAKPDSRPRLEVCVCYKYPTSY